MNLHEYQSKEIFSRYGVPIPRGKVVHTSQQAREIANRFGVPVVVKAQVLIGGRGKAGGIKLAHTPDEAERVAEVILGMHIKGLPVRMVLIDEAVEISKEIYLGLVIDRAARRVAMMASAEGGVEIEEVARVAPEKIVKVAIDPTLGLRDFQVRHLAHQIGLDAPLVWDFVHVGQALYRAFMASDASLAEINPLVVTKTGKLLAVDGKMVLDDNALFRHPDLIALRDEEAEDPLERAAREQGLNYVRLDGTIGCIVNGAGLAMTTMDIIQYYGAAPANFLDIGGGAKASKVAAALRILLAEPKIKAVLLNVFGGITRCDEVARGIVTALREARPKVPMIARLVGTNEEEGKRILAEARIITAGALTEAARLAVQAAREIRA